MLHTMLSRWLPAPTSKRIVVVLLFAGVLARPGAALAHDLYVKSFLVGVSPAASGGNDLLLRATVCNSGPTVAPPGGGLPNTKTFSIGFWARDQLPGACFFIPDREVKVEGGLAPQACVTKEVWVRGVINKTVFDFASVLVDNNCEITELKESNNLGTRSWTVPVSKPDLHVIDSFSASPDGSKVTYTVKVCNIGPVLATPFDVALHYDRGTAPPLLSPADDSARFVAGLAKGSCGVKTFVRTGAPPGSYTAWAQVDQKSEVLETNELNNDRSVSYEVGSPHPDLFARTSPTRYGSTFDVKLCNKGASTSATAKLGVFWNRTSAPVCGAKPDVVKTVSGIAGGSCKSFSVTETGQPAGAHTHLLIADPGCAVTESNETNNSATFVQLKGPDLFIHDMSAQISGSTVTYKVHIIRRGVDPITTPFDVSLYYGGANEPSCAATPDATISFPTGMSETWKILSFTRKVTSGGLEKVWARVDGGCAVLEYDETNNAASVTHSVGVSDLVIASFMVGASTSAASFVVMVVNAGPAISKPFSLGLYHDRASAPACGDLPDQSVTISGLASGAIITRVLTRTGVTQVGDATAWVMVDAGCVVPEFSESNNLASQSYYVGPSAPNLELDNLDVTVNGATVTYDVTVCNSGKAIPAGASFIIGVYDDASAAPACTAAPSAQVAISAGLAHGACVNKTLTRSGAPNGAFTAWAVADASCALSESDEADNALSSPYVVGASTKPDLYVSKLKALVSGDTVTYVAKVCNAGAQSGQFTLGIYYHAAIAPKFHLTPDRKQTFSAGLASGACAKRTWVRAQTPAGSYTAWALADNADKIAESKEGNNRRSAAYEVLPQLPDLTVTNLDVSSREGKIELEATVCNSGQSAAAASTLHLFVSDKTPPSCSAAADASLQLNALAAQGCQTVAATLAAPAAGTHLAWALSDGACAVTEGDETNNATSAVYVIAAPSADAGPSDAAPADSGLPSPDLGPPPDAFAQDQGASADLAPTSDALGPDTAARDAGVDATTPETAGQGGGCAVDPDATASPSLRLSLLLLLCALSRRRRG